MQGTFIRPQAPACPYHQQVSKQGELGGGHSRCPSPLDDHPAFAVVIGLSRFEANRMGAPYFRLGEGRNAAMGEGERNSLPVRVGWWFRGVQPTSRAGEGLERWCFVLFAEMLF